MESVFLKSFKRVYVVFCFLSFTFNGFAQVNDTQIKEDTIEYTISFVPGPKITNKKWGFIDKTGKEVISLDCEYVEDFSGGLAKINKKNQGYGFIDKTGKEVVPCIYNSVEIFSKDLILARTEKQENMGF